ncbi:hypothetical protein IKG73_01235 [Candidatus Saccharibacteria bacterium]|nr:hypothetical protein [Candidatus Saccharibacteria bacterium]
MKKSITKFVVAVGLFAAGLLGISHAEEVSALDAYLRVSPTSFNYDLKPGETISGKFELKNLSDHELNYDLKAAPYFTETDDTGKVSYRYDVENTYTQIKDWVTFDKTSGIIDADGSADINFTINVPLDVPGGGQYVALLATTKDDKNESTEGNSANIGEVMQIGPIVYAKIAGDTRETGEILKNETNGFLFNPPITVSATVKNTGNVHTKASFTMRVFPFFGGESIYNNEENPATVVVLPGATRYYNLSWDNAPSIGIYKVESEVKIFNEVSKIERTIIICPMWVLILIIVFILAVIFWIVTRVRARKAES